LSVDQIVVSDPGLIPRPISSSRISASVMPLRVVVSSRSRSSCPAKIGGYRKPPIFAGAVLPVSRTRCISLIAADGLTSNRAAASRAELPSATARTSRWRKSSDKGAVITASLLNRHSRIRTAESVQPQTALAPNLPDEPRRMTLPVWSTVRDDEILSRRRQYSSPPTSEPTF
jgi:hypothetical protein